MANKSKKHQHLCDRARAVHLDVTEVKGYLIPFRGSHSQGYFCKTLDEVERRIAEIEKEQRDS